MTALATSYPTGLIVPTVSRSYSDAGRSLERSVVDALEPEHTLAAERHREFYQRATEAVPAAVEEGISPSADALGQALQVLRVLPPWVPAPQAVFESDNVIALDWYESPRHALTLHVGARGIVGYSALVGSEITHGRVAFVGELPATVALLLARVLAGP
jgi:hypothetical protein